MSALRRFLAGLLFAFDRAACSYCSRIWIRHLVVDQVGAVEWTCGDCEPDRRLGLVVDFGREQAVTTTHLDEYAVRVWRRRAVAQVHRRPTVRRTRQLRTLVAASPKGGHR